MNNLRKYIKTVMSREQNKRKTNSAATLQKQPFGFYAKTNFDASKDLLVTRSNSYALPQKQREYDIWKRPPPDFRPQVYRPNPPKRNTRESMMTWKYNIVPEEIPKKKVTTKEEVSLPKVLEPADTPDRANMQLRFKIPDPYEAKLLSFAQKQMHPQESYVPPVPFDFRGYPSLEELGLPRFVTSYDHDPYNIHFKSQRINMLYGMMSLRDERAYGKQIGSDVYKLPLKWKKDLILPQEKYPIRYGEFTRHRPRNRTPHSALMERIEEKLLKTWDQEKEERARIAKLEIQRRNEQEMMERIAKKVDQKVWGNR